MRQKAVVLCYLEWVRLIGTGAIRLDEGRIVRWRPDRADPAEVVADLMLRAPDLGTSATSFVLTTLKPEVLDRIPEGEFYLGQRLDIEAVLSFHSFGDTALAIHRHDAEAAGVPIDLTPLAAGWAPWTEAVEAADRRARGEALLALLDVPPCGRFDEAMDRLAYRERHIAPDDIIRTRDTMFFGWACVLNAQKVSTGKAPSLPAEVKEEADTLRRDFDVDQPFFARAPRLRNFVAAMTVEGDGPADLLAMASLKQHERYVIKREGAALDLPSLLDDIRILEKLDAGAAGFLVQALGERLPGELIRAMKVQGVTRTAVPAGASSSTNNEMPAALGQSDHVAVDPTSALSPPQRPAEAPPSSELLTKTDVLSDGPEGSAVGTEIGVSAEALTIPPSEAATKPMQEVDVSSESTDRPQGTSALVQPGFNFDRDPTDPKAASPEGTSAPPGRKPRQQSNDANGSKANSRRRTRQNVNSTTS